MAGVELRVGGRTYEIACRDGEEAHFRSLAALVDEKAQTVGRALGGMNEARQLLLAALLLADDLGEARKGAPAPPPAAPAEDPWAGITPLLEEIADRLERAAKRLDYPGELGGTGDRQP